MHENSRWKCQCLTEGGTLEHLNPTADFNVRMEGTDRIYRNVITSALAGNEFSYVDSFQAFCNVLSAGYLSFRRELHRSFAYPFLAVMMDYLNKCLYCSFPGNDFEDARFFLRP